jgi:hypothetical protein
VIRNQAVKGKTNGGFMELHSDYTYKFVTVKIEFADLNARNDFKRLTNTDPIHSVLLDFELIFPIPPNPSLEERFIWRDKIWGSYAIDCELQGMEENGTCITYKLSTKVGLPVEFVKNLYLHSRIKKISIHCLDGCDLIYANHSRTAPCRKPGCEHDDCEMVFQEWEVVYDWSGFPHPLLEVDRMLSWIRDSFHPENESETGLIYHQILSQIVKFKQLGNSVLVNEAKNEFERQVSICGNAYVGTMVVINDCERSPDYSFKNGQRLIYEHAVDYYLKKTQPVHEVPRFPIKKKKNK